MKNRTKLWVGLLVGWVFIFGAANLQAQTVSIAGKMTTVTADEVTVEDQERRH